MPSCLTPVQTEKGEDNVIPPAYIYLTFQHPIIKISIKLLRFSSKSRSELSRNVQTYCEHFSLSMSMQLGMPPFHLSDVLLRHSKQHYSVEMFSRALATIILSLLWFGVGCF